MRLALLAAAPVIAAAATGALAQSQPGDTRPGAAAAAPGRPQAQGWTVGLGVATVFGTAWQGSRETALAIFPDLRIAYNDTLSLSVPEGLAWTAVKADGWRAGPLVKARFGRNEDNGGSPFLVAGGSTALAGMGDIGIAGEAGAFIEKQFGRSRQWRGRVELRRGFGAHQGIVGDVSLVYAGRTGRTMYSLGPRATLASRSYMQTYFGVDPGQSARTGLAVSRPEGGLVSWGLAGNVILPVARQQAILLFGAVDRLGGAPAGTSLIRERGQRASFTAGLAYTYRFRL